jgi:hypothetical protein
MDNGHQLPAHPALDYWSTVITIIFLFYRANLSRTAAASRLAAAMANPDSPVADAAAAQLQQMLVGDGMEGELVEVLLVLLGHCLAAVGPLRGAPHLADAQLAALDPYQVVQEYLGSKGIPELGAGGWRGGCVGVGVGVGGGAGAGVGAGAGAGAG